MTESTQNTDLNSRVARLETSMSAIERQQGAIIGKLEALSGEFQAARRPQWQLLLGLIVVILSLGTGAGSIIMLAQRGAIAPLEQRVASQITYMDDQKTRLDRVQERGEENSRSITGLLEHQTEIETQFRTLSYISNLADQEQERFLKLLWRRTYDEDLPSNGVRPVVGE